MVMGSAKKQTWSRAMVAGSVLAWASVASAQDAPADNAQPQAEAAPAAPEQEPLVGYKKGFFIQSQDGRFKLKIQGRVQARYTHEFLDEQDDRMAFSIPRARLTLSGHAFTENLTYKFQSDFGKGNVSLKDFYADYRFVPGWLHLRVGQYKRPFSRQQLTSSGQLEFVDRAITDRYFGAGRDIGLAIHNDYEKSPAFEYALGVFNGTGDQSHLSGNVAVDLATGEGKIESGRFSNVPARLHPALVTRVGYNHGGIKGYREADLEGGPLRFAIGGSGLMDLNADGDDSSGIEGEVDYIVKAHGFSTSGAAYVSSAQSGPGFSDQAFQAVGFHLQAGYVIADIIQPAVRYARIAPKGPDNDLQEILGGLSVYFHEHDVKWQTDGGALLSQVPGGGRTDFLVRSQLQLGF